MQTEREKELQEELDSQKTYGITLNELVIDLGENIEKNEKANQNLESQITLLQKEKKTDQKKIEDLRKELTKVKNENSDILKRKRAITQTVKEVNYLWNHTEIIDRKDKDDVLGDDWENELLNLNDVEKINERKQELINKIKERKTTEEGKQAEYEKQIQEAIDEAQEFIGNFYLPNEKLEKLLSRKLLEQMETIQNEWGTSSYPAKYRAFLSKNVKKTRSDEKKGFLFDLIQTLETRILAEEAIRSITHALNKESSTKLHGADIGYEYDDFQTKLRQMNKEQINDYENKAIELAASIRPVRAMLDKLIDSSEKILDNNNNSEKVQKDRENVLDFIFELEKFRYSTQKDNEVIWLTHFGRRTKVTELANPLSGKLFKLARDQSVKRLTESRELLKNWGVNVADGTFNKYESLIRRASSQELRSRKYEDQFRADKANQRPQASQAQIQQVGFPSGSGGNK